jgi:hypothetical protein
MLATSNIQLRAAADMSEVIYEERQIPVKLSAKGNFGFDVIGTLSRTRSPARKTLSVMVSGATGSRAKGHYRFDQ